MDTVDMTGLLGFGTLAVGLVIAIIIWLRFMRKPQNRHPMKGQRDRNIGEIRRESDRPVDQKADRSPN
jgi:hypothetical protein